jgi:hypothetical protein
MLIVRNHTLGIFNIPPLSQHNPIDPISYDQYVDVEAIWSGSPFLSHAAGFPSISPLLVRKCDNNNSLAGDVFPSQCTILSGSYIHILDISPTKRSAKTYCVEEPSNYHCVHVTHFRRSMWSTNAEVWRNRLRTAYLTPAGRLEVSSVYFPAEKGYRVRDVDFDEVSGRICVVITTGKVAKSPADQDKIVIMDVI